MGVGHGNHSYLALSLTGGSGFFSSLYPPPMGCSRLFPLLRGVLTSVVDDDGWGMEGFVGGYLGYNPFIRQLDNNPLGERPNRSMNCKIVPPRPPLTAPHHSGLNWIFVAQSGLLLPVALAFGN